MRHLDPSKLERPFPQQTIAAAAEYGDDENDDEESERARRTRGRIRANSERRGFVLRLRPVLGLSNFERSNFMISHFLKLRKKIYCFM